MGWQEDNRHEKGFNKIGKEFLLVQRELSGSQVKCYIALLMECNLKNSLSVEMSHGDFNYWTGIKDGGTITSAIKGLVKNGWIKNIVPQMNSSYIYTISMDKSEPNIQLYDWLDERGKKQAEVSKKKKLVRDDSGKFIKSEVPKPKEEISENQEAILQV